VLLALALLGVAVVILRTGSAARDWVRTRRVVALFRRSGREMGGLPLPASRAAHPFPVAALAGVWRPRLLLSEQVIGALSREELDAVLAHELAHLDARDNLKRLLLVASPDALGLTSGGRLRSEFLEATEAAADARACGRVSPTVLARAILKVARLVPAGGRLEVAVASFHHEGSLVSRVVSTPWSGDRPVRSTRGTHHGASSRALWWSGSPWPWLSVGRSLARTPCSTRCTAHSSVSCTCSPRGAAREASRSAATPGGASSGRLC
jgi:hypothetical protein